MRSLTLLSSLRRTPGKFYWPTCRSHSSMSVADFVAAATKAHSSLAGSSDKAKAEIAKLEKETQAMSSNLTVS